jgi:hypothetical protein
MRDGPLRRLIKLLVRTTWALEHSLRRRLRSRPRWRLEGECNGCGQCCVAPSIAVGRLLWRWPTPRRLFLSWQRHVNGFELTGRIREARAFVFRCTHYDPQTRQCDSYASRPWMCRRYPRVLLRQPWPELFEDCSHRLVDGEGAGLAAALDAEGLDPELRARLQGALRLPKSPSKKQR